MTFRVVRTNQYNQDLGLIHSTNGNHLESPKEGSSIDHQVTIYLHAQNITMFPTNETCFKYCDWISCVWIVTLHYICFLATGFHVDWICNSIEARDWIHCSSRLDVLLLGSGCPAGGNDMLAAGCPFVGFNCLRLNFPTTVACDWISSSTTSLHSCVWMYKLPAGCDDITADVIIADPAFSLLQRLLAQQLISLHLLNSNHLLIPVVLHCYVCCCQLLVQHCSSAVNGFLNSDCQQIRQNSLLIVMTSSLLLTAISIICADVITAVTSSC
ncbi:calmodulin-binding protein [Dorcoceras hygrometricum]|uniref:Calmodulin-binding protein n=1 Tax=Dorcoceras hygrometricum TaxID=472368 RepID=A0A2Z7A5I3_9LAMI|nr:calmodulin-binding protein [Dorcoceras hygrometricum]